MGTWAAWDCWESGTRCLKKLPAPSTPAWPPQILPPAPVPPGQSQTPDAVERQGGAPRHTLSPGTPADGLGDLEIIVVLELLCLSLVEAPPVSVAIAGCLGRFNRRSVSLNL